MEVKHPAQLLFSDKHPLTDILKMQFEVGERGTLSVWLQASDQFADVDGAHTHTGFTTLFLDTVMGACAIGELKKPQPIATVKLNCNHLSRLKIGEEAWCHATYDGEENSLAFVSAKVVAGEEKRLVATAIGTFMIGTAAKPLEVRK